MKTLAKTLARIRTATNVIGVVLTVIIFVGIFGLTRADTTWARLFVFGGLTLGAIVGVVRAITELLGG
jgi:hypothetical protein